MKLFRFFYISFFLFISTHAFSNSKALFSHPDLCKLLQATDLPCEKDPKKIVEITQKHWLREYGKERWEIQEKSPNKRTEILKLVRKLGFVEAVQVQKKQYDYALILGALAPTMKKRLGFLVQQWKKGVRFKKIFFLVGERPRDPVMESSQILLERNKYIKFPKHLKLKTLPQTETDLAKMIYFNAILPKQFSEIPFEFVNTPRKIQNAKLIRPTTADTVEFLFEKQWIPKKASLLSISNQPYIPYQDAILRGALLQKGDFDLETVGFESDADTKISVYLDSLARTLYSEL